MGGQVLYLCTSSRASRIKRLAASFANPIRRYNHSRSTEERHGHVGVEERAPSTAEEFKRVAEEKARQGVARQTVEKAEDGTEAAIMDDTKIECVKERYKEAVGKGNFHKTGDDE